MAETAERPAERLAPTIDEISIADDPDRWAALGFTVTDGTAQLGGVAVQLAGRAAGRGIIGWSLRGVAGADLDGLPTTVSERPPRAHAGTHAGTLLGIDHIVAFTPSLDRTVQALQAAGLDLRRIREQPTPAGAPRQAFFRLGAEILEVVQLTHDGVEHAGGPDAPARFWGLALRVSNLDDAVRRLGSRAGEIRPAVQPGQRIATLRRSAGLAIPVALMSKPAM